MKVGNILRLTEIGIRCLIRRRSFHARVCLMLPICCLKLSLLSNVTPKILTCSTVARVTFLNFIDGGTDFCSDEGVNSIVLVLSALTAILLCKTQQFNRFRVSFAILSISEKLS